MDSVPIKGERYIYFWLNCDFVIFIFKLRHLIFFPRIINLCERIDANITLT